MSKRTLAPTTYNRGYRRALLDVAELLNNAARNDAREHRYEELMDQLAQLGTTHSEQHELSAFFVTHDELLQSGNEE